jgi:hypothetical protein
MPPYSVKFLDAQGVSIFIAHTFMDSKAFLRRMEAKRDPLGSDGAVAQRVRLLRAAMGYGEVAAFARYLGVERPRLANVENGLPLGIALARRIRDRTGASLDWLYEGDASRLEHELRVKVFQAEDGGGARKGKTAKS